MRVVVGITGGIASYKAVNVVRAFVLAGHDVHVVATEHALRFVGRPTLEAISRNIVNSDLYTQVAEVRHVAIGQQADLVVVAPATANTIAKIAAGIADDLLGNTILASRAPLVIAPAMHTEMWTNPATVANIATLRARGIHIVGPASGALTGTDVGAGRMAEPSDIVEQALSVSAPQDFAGLHVLITAGGTREPLDPVRFLGNRSSGRQGIALASEAAARGANVTLIAAHVEVPTPAGVNLISVSTASELATQVASASAASDVVIMAAAVADYRPVSVAESKLRKENIGDTLTLELVKNPDILATLAHNARPHQTIVGFAAETASSPEELLKLGQAKIARKGCDLLVLNVVGWNEGFGTESNSIVVVDRNGHIEEPFSGTKLSVASRILDVIISRRSR